MIEAGSAAISVSGKQGGDFWSGTYHPECRAAEVEMNEAFRYGDDWISLSEIDDEDLKWLEINHPLAYSRIMRF